MRVILKILFRAEETIFPMKDDITDNIQLLMVFTMTSYREDVGLAEMQ